MMKNYKKPGKNRKDILLNRFSFWRSDDDEYEEEDDYITDKENEDENESVIIEMRKNPLRGTASTAEIIIGTVSVPLTAAFFLSLFFMVMECRQEQVFKMSISSAVLLPLSFITTFLGRRSLPGMLSTAVIAFGITFAVFTGVVWLSTGVKPWGL